MGRPCGNLKRCQNIEAPEKHFLYASIICMLSWPVNLGNLIIKALHYGLVHALTHVASMYYTLLWV